MFGQADCEYLLIDEVSRWDGFHDFDEGDEEKNQAHGGTSSRSTAQSSMLVKMIMQQVKPSA
jgi:hypothetical protein